MSARSLVGAVLVAAAAIAAAPTPAIPAVARASSSAVPLPPSPADPAHPITDPGLLAALDVARGSHPRVADAPPSVGVETLTPYTAAIANRVVTLGGSVVGAVDGQLVQATVPIDRVDDLALADGVQYVRAPRAVNRPVRSQPGSRETAAGFGVVVGEATSLTNASAWQAAGFSGAVKVGIIDYFNLGLWKPLEVGPVPDAAHRFCRDTADDGDDVCSAVYQGPINNHDGFEHGVAVAEVLKDIAPGAELYLATAATATDLVAAIDFFAANGVHLVTRSLGAAFDGPGDGTGPLDSVVDYAAARAINWFNSAGNDAVWGYARVTVPADLASTGGYVDFDPGPGVDTLLRISGECVLFDGVRWSDWKLPNDARTDYSVEMLAPTSDPTVGQSENANPGNLVPLGVADGDQGAGAPPLELADAYVCSGNSYGSDGGVMYLRIRRKPGTPVVGPPDVLEVGVAQGFIEAGRWQAASSAAKPVVDSRNPALVAVGAVDPANGSGSPEPIGIYSSQGPTNDGRIKPDVSAPSCVLNTIYFPSCFSGTSSAAPTVAGLAALLLDANVAQIGAPLSAAVEHFTIDRPFNAGGAPDGPDNKYGAGQAVLPAPPSGRIGSMPPTPMLSAYHQVTPTRILDTRPMSSIGPTVGTRPQNGIVDVGITSAVVPAGATAVAVNITVTGTLAGGYVQAVPYLRAPFGTSSTLNVPAAGATKANFSIVPIGVDGKISVYLVPGGDLIVDVLGYFAPADAATAAGRFVAIDPVRTLDTRVGGSLAPAGWQPHTPANETIVVPSSPAVPAGIAALVLNVTSTQSTSPGYLRAQPTGTATTTSTVNFAGGGDASNTVIVPVGADGTVSVYANTTSHVVVDITGYITGDGAPAATTGLFVPVVTGRLSDSRTSGGPFAKASTRAIQVTGLPAPFPAVPAPQLAGTPGATVTGVSVNITAANEVGAGYLSAFAAGAALPATSSLNYVDNQPVANGILVKVSANGGLAVYANTQTDVIVDINGYFT